jgi:6-phosphogluconolactonase
MSVYRIDKQTGALTALEHYPVGKNPNWIEFARFEGTL